MSTDTPAAAAQLLSRLCPAGATELHCDHRRLRALLEDAGSLPTRAVNLIWLGSHARVPLELRGSSQFSGAVSTKCIERLMREYGLTRDAASWCIEVWRLCLAPAGPGVWAPGEASIEATLLGYWHGHRFIGAGLHPLSLEVADVRSRAFSGSILEPETRRGREAPVIRSAVTGHVQPDGLVSFVQRHPELNVVAFSVLLSLEKPAAVLRGQWQSDGKSGRVELTKVGPAA